VKNTIGLTLSLSGLLLVIVIAGCGGGSSAPPPPPPVIIVSITATSNLVLAGGTAGLTASATGDPANKGVTWSISPPSGAGMLTNETSTSATYKAPATPPPSDLTVTITATSVTDPSQSATTNITVPAIVVSLSATSTQVQAGGSSVITATVTNDPANQGVNQASWTLTQGGAACSPGCGTLSNQTSSSATYNAPVALPMNSINLTITATSISDSRQTGNIVITFEAIQISISPSPATVAEDTSLQFTATVSFDPNNAGVTWTLTQGTPPAPCSPACGTISAPNSPSGTPITYSAPSAVPSPNTVTLTATSVTDARQSSSSTVTVVNPDSALTGQYAFLFHGFDDATGKQIAAAGSFTADGFGNITGGEEDINDPSGVHALVTFTGTYIVGLDNRGTITLSNSLPGNVTYAFGLGSFNAGVAAKGRLIEFDDASGATGTRGSGFMRLQDPTAFLQSKITGLYGFGISGQDSTGGRLASAGLFSADGAGNISGGTEDINDAGTVTNSVSFTGTYSAPDATNGRATGTVSTTSPAQTTHFSLYVVSASEAFLMTTDAESTAGLQSGTVLSQASTPYSNSSLNASSVFYEVGVNSASPTTQSDLGIGLFTANGTGGLTIVSDENDGGTITTNKTISGFTYSVASNGRVTITGGAATPPILYLVDNNKAFVLGANASVGSGFLEPQSGGPFTSFSLSGTFSFGVAPPAVTASTVSSGVATASNGCFRFFFGFRCFHTLRVTQDSSASNGTLTSGATSSVGFTVSSNGRTTMNNAVIYIISPSKFVRIDEITTDVAPTVSIFEK
jgi:hypothetical protein